MVPPTGGILAADESIGSAKKRLDMVGLENTYENREIMRRLMLTSPGLKESGIDAVILFAETFDNLDADGNNLITEHLIANGIQPGIKTDGGLIDDPDSPGEQLPDPKGLTELPGKLDEFKAKGAVFTKWRTVQHIDAENGLPTETNIRKNGAVHGIEARQTQEKGMIPIVEPEVMHEKSAHTLEQSYDATVRTLEYTFDELVKADVYLEGMILKTSMILAGQDAEQTPAEVVGFETLKGLLRSVPSAVPSIVFLSGGQKDDQVVENLDAVLKASQTRFNEARDAAAAELEAEGQEERAAQVRQLTEAPWEISYSFGRGLQRAALLAWGGEPSQYTVGQDTMSQTARVVQSARLGQLGVDNALIAQFKPADFAHPEFNVNDKTLIFQSLVLKGLIDEEGVLLTPSLMDQREDGRVIANYLGLEPQMAPYAHYILAVLNKKLLSSIGFLPRTRPYADVVKDTKAEVLLVEEAKIRAELAIEMASGLVWDQSIMAPQQEAYNLAGRKSTTEWREDLAIIEAELERRVDNALQAESIDNELRSVRRQLSYVRFKLARIKAEGVTFSPEYGSFHSTKEDESRLLALYDVLQADAAIMNEEGTGFKSIGEVLPGVMAQIEAAQLERLRRTVSPELKGIINDAIVILDEQLSDVQYKVLADRVQNWLISAVQQLPLERSALEAEINEVIGADVAGEQVIRLADNIARELSKMRNLSYKKSMVAMFASHIVLKWQYPAADTAMFAGLEHPTLHQRARDIEEARRLVRERDGRYIDYPHTPFQIAATTAPIENDLLVTRFAGRKYTFEQRENFRTGSTSGTYGVTNQVESEAVGRSGKITKAEITDQHLAEILGLDAPMDLIGQLREDLRKNGYIDENNVVTDAFVALHPKDMTLDGDYGIHKAKIFLGMRRVIWERMKSIYQGGWAAIMKYFGASDQAKEPMTYLSKQADEMSSLLISHARHQEAAISLMGLTEQEEILYRASAAYNDFYIPIMLDFDHTHGKPHQLTQANLTVGRDGLLVATVHIEDQCKKKCGHMPRKSLVTTKDWLENLSAVRQQLDAMGLYEVSIVHRTDAEDAHIISGDDDGRDQEFLRGMTNYLNKETRAAAIAQAEQEARAITAQQVKDEVITEDDVEGIVAKAVETANAIIDAMINNDKGRLTRYHRVIVNAQDRGTQDKELAAVDAIWKKLAGLKTLDQAIEETIIAQGDAARITIAEWREFLQSIPREYSTDYLGIVKAKANEVGITVHNVDQWDMIHELAPDTLQDGNTHILWDHNATVTHSDGNHFWMISSGLPMAISRNSSALALGDSPWMEQKKAFILEIMIWAMALDQKSVDITLDKDFWGLLEQYGAEFKEANAGTIEQLLRGYLIQRRLAPEDSFLKTRDELVALGVSVETAVHLINSVSRAKSNNTSPSFRWPFAKVGMSSAKLQSIIDDVLKFQPSFKHVATKAEDFQKIWDDTYAAFGLTAEPVLDVERDMTDEERKTFLTVQGRDSQKQFSTYFGEVKNHVLSQLFLEGIEGREAEDKVREVFNEIFKNGFLTDEMYVVSKLQELGYAIDNAFTDNSQVFAGVVYDTIREATGKGEAMLFQAYGGASDTQGKSVAELKDKGKDEAMTVTLKPDTTGGIDLNPELMDLQIKRDGNGVALPLLDQPVDVLQNIEGFIPVIIQMTPITNMPLILGMGIDPEPTEFSYQPDLDMDDPRARLEDLEADKLSYLK